MRCHLTSVRVARDCFLTSLIVFIAAGKAAALSQTPASQAPTPRAAFRAAIDELTRHWKITIVAEGGPIIGPSQPGQVAIQPHDTPEQAVGRVATAFDYTVSQYQRVFVLNKRFTNPDEIPDLTLEEARDSLFAIARLFSQFSAYDNSANALGGSPALELLSLLTKEQLNEMSAGGLQVSSLTPAQQAETMKLATFLYVNGTANAVGKNAKLIDSIFRQDPAFHWGRIGMTDEFGYDIKRGSLPKDLFKNLSHPDTVHVLDDGVIMTIHDQTVNGVPVDPPSDPTNPDPTTTNTKGVNSPDETVDTLKAVAARLNTRATDQKCRVDHAFETKSVTVSGAENSSTSRVTAALADVYGLTIRHALDGTIVITHGAMPVVENVTLLGAALSAMVPKSIAHILEIRAMAYEKESKIPLNFLRMQGLDYGRTDRTVSTPATKQVRTGAEPAVRHSNEHQVHLSALTEEYSKAFAVSQALPGFLSALSFSVLPVPEYLTRLDEAVLTGSLTSDRWGQKLTVHLEFFDTATGYHRGAGGSYRVTHPPQ